MKVLINVDYFPPDIGGSSLSDYFLYKGLKEIGINVDVTKNKIPNKKYDIILTTGTKNVFNIRKYLTKDKTLTYFLVRDYRLFCPRYTLFNGKKNCSNSNFFKCTSCYLTNPFFLPSYFRMKLLKKYLKDINFIARSKFIKKFLNECGFKCKKILYPPLKLPEDFKKQDNKNMLFAGKLIPEKGLDVLLRALALVKTDFKLNIVGTGNIIYYKKLANKLKINNKISFLGLLEYKEVIKLMKNFGIFILPSLWNEPLSRGMLEAMSCKMAVIATNTGGTKEVINNKNGILIKPDIKELANAMEDLILNEKLRKKLSENARKTSENFEYKKIAKELIKKIF